MSRATGLALSVYGAARLGPRAFEQGIADTVDWYLAHQAWVERVTDGSNRLERIGTAA